MITATPIDPNAPRHPSSGPTRCGSCLTPGDLVRFDLTPMIRVTLCASCRADLHRLSGSPHLATPTPERRPAVGWVVLSSVAYELPVLVRAPVQEWQPFSVGVEQTVHGGWTMYITDADGDSLVKPWPNGGDLFDGSDEAMLAAEDAAARLLIAALAELPDASRLMAEAATKEP